MPGPGKKPTSLKVVAGTDRPDRRNESSAELPAVSELPRAPSWLSNAHAKKEWDRLGPILVANGLLTEAGLSAFGVMCSLHGKIIQLFAAGETPVASMVSQYRNLVNDFGLTPVAQGKVKPTSDAKKENRFSRNGRRAS